MGHGKLIKFAQNETFSCLLQPSSQELLSDGYFNLKDHSIKGRWKEFFKDAANPGSLVLELGCGKGEYTIDLACRNPQSCYVGVDIKGARLWKGAKYATENDLPNVGFLRTRIEFINAFFAQDEVDQIWLTFSDPQLKSENSRLTSPMFLERYRKFLKPGGVIHLKTDSRFLHEYTKAVCKANSFEILACTSDLYGDSTAVPENFLPSGGSQAAGASLAPEIREVKTFYEKMSLNQGFKITYMAFRIDGETPIVKPSDPEVFDSKFWRSLEEPRHFFGQAQ